ncbi:MAG: CBS and ACT domain-containing protein [Bacillota bacterium]
MFVKRYMTPNPVTMFPDTSISEALTTMRTKGFRHIPVVNQEGLLLGIVSQTDLLKVSPSPATSLSIWELNYLIAKMTIADAMVQKVVTIKPEATVEEAAILLRGNKIGSLVVIDDHKRVVGILTETDIFDAFLAALGSGSGGARLVVKCDDHPGSLSRIAQILAERNINVKSLTTFPAEEGKGFLVFRLECDELQNLLTLLESAGLEVVSAG